METSTQIFSNNGMLVFDREFPLATKEEYETADRCIGSVFEALLPAEHIQLKDGHFVLDDELDLIENWDIVLVQYPASGEVYDVALVWDGRNKFFERVRPSSHQLEEDEDEWESFHEVERSHAQAEVIIHQSNMFDWMKSNAQKAGLVVTNQIKAYSNYEYKGEKQGDDDTDFHYYSVVAVERNSESPFYFHDSDHARSARHFVSLIASDFENSQPIKA
jgi:hypothetical protein